MDFVSCLTYEVHGASRSFFDFELTSSLIYNMRVKNNTFCDKNCYANFL